MKIEIKNRFTGEVIFSNTQENNTMEITLGLAIKAKIDLSEANLSRASLIRADLSGASLSGANLYRADLSGADLSGASLSGANLYRASLSGADLYRASLSGADLYRASLSGASLSGANLSGASLSGADLSGADLYRASLSGADLSGAIGNMSVMFSMQLETYPITFTKYILQIGCKRFTHDEWRNFDDDTIKAMDSKALAFWKKWKDFIFMAIELRFKDEK